MKKTLAATLLSCSALVAFGQGTVAFSNPLLCRISTGQSPDLGTTAPVPTTPGFLEYGLFYGIGQSTSLTLLTAQFGVNSTSVAGLIASPADSKTPLTVVPIPGTNPNETDVWLQVKAWSAFYGTDWVAARAAWDVYGSGTSGVTYGESRVANITAGLGASVGPGAVIWGAASNTSGTVIPAFVLVPAPEPAGLALGALGGVLVGGRIWRTKYQRDRRDADRQSLRTN
jgi:hypothetical protein